MSIEKGFEKFAFVVFCLYFYCMKLTTRLRIITRGLNNQFKDLTPKYRDRNVIDTLVIKMRKVGKRTASQYREAVIVLEGEFKEKYK